jgi:hypothetical protein
MNGPELLHQVMEHHDVRSEWQGYWRIAEQMAAVLVAAETGTETDLARVAGKARVYLLGRYEPIS